MKATVLIQAAAVAAFAFTAFAASAAPQEVQKLPRVVITGKSTQAVAQVQQLPRVVVTGYAVRDVAQVQQLPRVTVTARRAVTVYPRQSSGDPHPNRNATCATISIATITGPTTGSNTGQPSPIR